MTRMPKGHGTALASLTERDRTVALTLAATVLCPGALLRWAHFPRVTYEVYRRSIARLSALRVVERVRIGPLALAHGHGEVLFALTDTGWRLVSDLGAATPPQAMRHQALALPAAVVAAAEAYALALTSGALTAGAQWALQPATGLVPPPAGAWATLSSHARVLALDLDLPGRSPEQTLTRLKRWAPYTRALQQEDVQVSVCYVVPAQDRRDQLQAFVRGHLGDSNWLTFAHPRRAAERVLSTTTQGG